MGDDGAEQNVRTVLENSKLFTMNGENFEIIQCSKPTVSGGGGEVKTDIYIKSKRIKDKKVVEIKISYKKPSFSFVENKIKLQRAKKIYGKQWSQIIQDQITEIKSTFIAKPLIYFKKQGKTEEGSITLGWRYEMEYNGTRKFSTKIRHNIAAQIWKNQGADERYIHGIVDGKQINFSGVPNFCLTKNPEEIESTKDIFESLVSMDDLIKSHGNITTAFLAQNFRSHQLKHGGNKRHFAVWIKWKIVNKKLGCEYIFDKPLEMESGKVYENLCECLLKLDVDIQNDFNISKLKGLIHKSVLTYT